MSHNNTEGILHLYTTIFTFIGPFLSIKQRRSEYIHRRLTLQFIVYVV